MKLAQVSVENQSFDPVKDLELGFFRGSIWQNLYVPFKYEYKDNKNLTGEEEIKHLIMVYNFASIDLSLYLCTHKNDVKAIEELKRVNSELEKIKYYYENKYRALTSCSSVNISTYVNNPWPWERK